MQSFKYLVSTAQVASLRKQTQASIKRLTGYEIRMGIAQAFTTAVREPLAVIAILVVVMVQTLWLNQPLAPILVSIILFYRGLSGVDVSADCLAVRAVALGVRGDGAR
jgi:hypothetical protein